MTTASELLNTVIELGTEQPDTKAKCRYFNPNATPCCIVGHAFEKHGITQQTLKEVPGVTYENLNRWSSIQASRILDLVGVDSDDPAAVSKLGAIQLAQDTGSTWGEALTLVTGITPTK
ncbi:hypothetical protein MycrhDRAFT_5756 [Mycolicibacterium rhodesiae JS60]|nr:hypothetical protein MycrhDRAFT_5756 [Mycolicibacterium rhodesiae JS60]